MDPDIKKLIDLTTIVKVEDNNKKKVVYGDEYVSRFEKNQGKQIDLSTLVGNWKNKWKSFNNKWTTERQNYRFLYDSFKLFYYSFEQLRFNKVACINEAFGNQDRMLHLNELTGVSLYGMYHYSKKCIDLLEELNLIDERHKDWDFLKKFKETRNKLIEHNYNPRGLNLLIDPSIWSLASTDSLLEIHIHKIDTERAFDAYVDYYEDYYQLEKIITNIIKKF